MDHATFIVDQIGLRRTLSYRVRNDVFCFKEHAGWGWLQRLCFFVLRKIGAFYVEETMAVRTITLDYADVCERLYQRHLSLLRDYNVHAATLLIGADDFAEMMQTPAVERLITFSLKGVDLRWNGLKIVIVPWMKGCVMLPDGL